ncbi:hypothetical protein B0H65DRAFT_538939 [Neurospora tetraspora]|uniref:Uncharacterized protein n=1 Tax=Neurospora tetraspora TaxID=94610 RepID=A0AAE0JIB8_9PEZI|nr:hypothetical protein B0H65DRAFT_538939 [Neurospora tetraspora]
MLYDTVCMITFDIFTAVYLAQLTCYRNPCLPTTDHHPVSHTRVFTQSYITNLSSTRSVATRVLPLILGFVVLILLIVGSPTGLHLHPGLGLDFDLELCPPS